VRYTSEIGISQKIRCRACLAADSNFAYLEMILYRAPASYAEANYNVDNYYVLNFDRIHSSISLLQIILFIPACFVNRNVFYYSFPIKLHGQLKEDSQDLTKAKAQLNIWN
jgi:hypothetical protein